mmetsp:Transcript_12935/g.24023  ORF Transcript_12935/g.24023 Transcript_12935/m.24023 type:complete len:207 (+) Transcript_12935:1471-2091(+)
MAFIITGFGPFGSVTENPTSILAQECGNALQPEGITVLHTRTVTVGYRAVEANVEELYGYIAGRESSEPIVLLHLGVYSGSMHFNIETQGANYCFIGRDAEGNSKAGAIDMTRECGETVCCRLNIDELHRRLSGEGFPVNKSQSAGGYLCNYIYYKSLVKFQAPNVYVLFVHMPEFHDISKEVQLRFLGSLCRHIKDLVASCLQPS